MVDSLPRPDASLPTLLAHRARHVPRGRLVLDTFGGAFLLVVALMYQEAGWPVVASAGGCFLSFGSWGLLDRAIARQDPKRRVLQRTLRIAQVMSAVAGVLAGAALLLVLFGYTLGPSWKL